MFEGACERVIHLQYGDTDLRDPDNQDFTPGIWYEGQFYRSYYLRRPGRLPQINDREDLSREIIQKHLRAMYNRVFAITGGSGTLGVIEPPTMSLKFARQGKKWRLFVVTAVFVPLPLDFDLSQKVRT